MNRAKALAMVMVVGLAGCDTAARDQAARIEAACGSVDFDDYAMFRAAVAGDLAAIDCLMVMGDITGLELEHLPEFDGSESIAWRYIRWIETGEMPADLLEIAARSDRDDAIGTTSLYYLQYLEAGGEPVLAQVRYTEEGCFIRPPRMDAIWRAGPPSALGDLCTDAVRDHPTH